MLDRTNIATALSSATLPDGWRQEPPYPRDDEISRHLYFKNGRPVMIVNMLAGGTEERFYFFQNNLEVRWTDKKPATFLPVLYNHDGILERSSEPIFFVETEQEADRLTSLGVVATSYGSAGSPPLYQQDLLKRRQILAIGRADAEGERFVQAVRDAYGDWATVRTQIVEHPLATTPEGYRFEDWLNDTAALDQKMWLLAWASGERRPLERSLGGLGSVPDGNVKPVGLTEHEKPEATQQPPTRSAEVILFDAAASGEIGDVATSKLEPPRHLPSRVVLSNDKTAGVEPEWLVDGLLPKEGAGMLYAPSSAGKTFIGIDLCYAIQNGQTWAGRAVKQGKAVFVAAEDSTGVCYRAVAQFDVGDYADPFIIVRADEQGLSLVSDGQDLRQLIEDIDSARGDDEVRLIIIETFEKIAEGIDENMSGPVGQVWSNLGTISRKFGCFVLLAHHTGKAGETYRGSSTFKNRADTVLSIEQRGDGKRGLQVVKQRNGISGLSAEFVLEAIPGTQTCRVVFTEDWRGGTDIESEKKNPKEGKGQQLRSAILGVLQERYSSAREAQVEKAELRQHPAILSCLGTYKNDAARKALERALVVLEEDGLIRRAGQTIELITFSNFESDSSKVGPDMSGFIFRQTG